MSYSDRKSNKLYVKGKGVPVAKSRKLSFTFDAQDIALIGKLQLTRQQRTGRIIGPTALIREALLALSHSDDAGKVN